MYSTLCIFFCSLFTVVPLHRRAHVAEQRAVRFLSRVTYSPSQSPTLRHTMADDRNNTQSRCVLAAFPTRVPTTPVLRGHRRRRLTRLMDKWKSRVGMRGVFRDGARARGFRINDKNKIRRLRRWLPAHARPGSSLSRTSFRRYVTRASSSREAGCSLAALLKPRSLHTTTQERLAALRRHTHTIVMPARARTPTPPSSTDNWSRPVTGHIPPPQLSPTPQRRHSAKAVHRACRVALLCSVSVCTCPCTRSLHPLSVFSRVLFIIIITISFVFSCFFLQLNLIIWIFIEWRLLKANTTTAQRHHRVFSTGK